MSLQLSTSARNALLDAVYADMGGSVVIRLFDGTMPANCAGADAGTKLAEYTLAASWMGTSSGGQKAIINTPLVVAALASGLATYFRVYKSGGATCEMQGSLSISGGGGDMVVDNANIVAGQNVTITGWTWNAPGA